MLLCDMDEARVSQWKNLWKIDFEDYQFSLLSPRTTNAS